MSTTLGARLRQLRTAAGMSLRQAAAAAHISRGYLSQVEQGLRHPSPLVLSALDRALDAGGELTARPPAPTPDAPDIPVEPAAVDSLAEVLAAQRRADDVLPPSLLLAGAASWTAAVSGLARSASGPHAGRLAAVAAEWRQFRGWLLAECRHDREAAAELETAWAEAVELADPHLTAQALDFRGWLHRQRQEWRPAVRAYGAAAETVGAAAGQRVICLTHGSWALSRCGDRAEAGRWLSRARRVLDTEPVEPVESAYWLSPSFVRLGVGLALAGLGDRAGAAEEVRVGLAELPPEWTEAEWRREYQLIADGYSPVADS